MGWGTFIAARMLRAPKKRESSLEWFSELYFGLFGSYIKSYKRRSIQGTVLLHPEVASKVDEVEWEVELQQRAVNHGLAQQTVLLVVSLVWGFLGVLHWGILVLPLLWYYLKNRLIKSCSREINNQFRAEGFDVDRLMREIPVLSKDQKEREQKEAEQELLQRQEDSYRKKFGIE
ncbi:MAG: hypothetical protein RLZZ485_559 [Actinomycetota bacterium]|jgi:hypothetical protein